MGLLASLNNAVSGLNINQKNLSSLSQNISNANTPNYSREIVNQSAAYINGEGVGVLFDKVTRSIDAALNEQVHSQTSINFSAASLKAYYGQIQNLLGQPGANNSIDTNISTFFNNLQTLGNSPTASARSNVVNSAVALSGKISSLANSLQQLRLQADGEIKSSIDAINADIKSLSALNTSITSAEATGQSTNGLLDKRDKLLNDISQYIDYKPVYNKAGVVTLSTSSGISLLNEGSYSQLSYTPVNGEASFTNDATISPISVTSQDSNGRVLGNPVNLTSGGSASGTSTSSIAGGKLQGLLSVRDTVIPGLLNQLDQLSSSLRNNVNAISNKGVSYPAPNSITGERLIAGSSTSQYSGSLRIATLKADGSAFGSPYTDEIYGVPPLTLDLSTLNTGQGAGLNSVDGIINTINQYYGKPQTKLELGNINNVQLSIATSSIPGASGQLNLDFNLSNISNTSADFFVTGVTVLDSSGAVVDGNPTLNVPSFSTTSFDTTTGSSVVTVNISPPNRLSNGDTIYLPPSGSNVGSITSAQLSGYFKVQNISGNSFQIDLGAVTQATAGNPSASTSVKGLTKYATVGAGSSVNTVNNGTIDATLSSNLQSPYYTVRATVTTFDTSGNPVTSTVNYRVGSNQKNSFGNVVGALNIASGAGTIVQPTITQSLATATLVDANGNELNKINGSYGYQQGYLKITATDSTQTIAIDQLDSQELGQPNAPIAVAGSHQGFSQFFGLNDVFTPNALTATGDTVRNSAINLAVRSSLIANPSLLSTGSLSQATQSSSTATNYTYSINSGDGSTALQLAKLGTQGISFDNTSGLAATTTTFSQYAGQIIANNSSNSVAATNTLSDSQALLDGFTARAQSISGVNLDQELANTVIYQNSYSASARVISVVKELFSTLLSSFQ